MGGSGLSHNRFSSDIESVQSTYPSRVSKAFAAGSEDAGFWPAIKSPIRDQLGIPVGTFGSAPALPAKKNDSAASAT